MATHLMGTGSGGEGGQSQEGQSPRRCLSPYGHERISLCETLDRVLNKGAVIRGEVMITVADVDLIYLDLGLLLTSVETAMITGAILPGMKSQVS